MSDTPWWKNPQGLVATATIVTMILGFFYVREKQMWEQSARISSLETRGDSAIHRFDLRASAVEKVLSDLRDQVNFLERKIDRLELLISKRDKENSERSPIQ